MSKKNIANYFGKTSLIWEAMLLCVMIFLQHRFWIFRNIYKNFGTAMGSGGDSYYNLAIYLQNLNNFNNGQWYSLEGDHYTFYSNIIGVTAHNYAPSLVFAFLYKIFDNPIFVFNFIFFGNIFLTQIGIYLLVRFYTKNKFASLLTSILVPLSQATVWTYYTGHIHAALYWALPFLILLLELFLLENFKIKKTNPLTKNFNLTNIKIFIYILGILVTSLWIFFAEWHILIFSSFWIAIWLLFKLKSFFIDFKKYKIQIISILSVWILCILLLLPLGLNYVKTSKIYNSTRTLDAVASTNFSTESFFGNKIFILAGLNATKGVVQNINPETKTLNDVTTTVSQNGSDFPDKITNFSFILLNILFLPFIFWWISSKQKKYTLEVSLALIFLICSWVALGPVLKIANHKIEYVLLPHYFLYQILFPLQAIRAIWRITAISYLSILVFWAVVLSTYWEYIKAQVIQNFPSKKLTRFYIFGLKLLIGILSIVLIFVQQSGFLGNSIPAISQINPILDAISNLKSSKEKTFFIWQKGGNDDGLDYQLSLHNLKKGHKELNWVAGGIAGTYPDFLSMTTSFINSGKYLDVPAKILAAKKVDFIIYNREVDPVENLKFELSIQKYYERVAKIDNKEIWQLNNIPEYISNYADLNYFLTLSKYQNTSDKIQLLVNIENSTDKVFALQEKVKAEEYVFNFYKNGKKIKTQKLEIGGIAALNPQLGLSYSKELDTVWDTGDIEIKMYSKANKLLATSQVKILSNFEYNKLIIDNEKDSFDYNSTPIRRDNISLGIDTYPVKLSVDVKAGILKNYPQKLVISSNNSVIVNYKNKDGADYGGFPGWLFQPTCHLRGNYFPGDELKFWCVQYLPFDDTFNYSSIKFNQDR
jgi:hypothetical protein